MIFGFYFFDVIALRDYLTFLADGYFLLLALLN